MDSHERAQQLRTMVYTMIQEALERGEAVSSYALYAVNVGELTEEDMQWGRKEAKRLSLR